MMHLGNKTERFEMRLSESERDMLDYVCKRLKCNRTQLYRMLLLHTFVIEKRKEEEEHKPHIHRSYTFE